MTFTQEDFLKFQDAVWKWIKFFGLFDWEPAFGFDDETILPKNASEVTIDLQGKMAKFVLYAHQTVDRPIDRLAFHEVCEVLIGRLTIVAGYRYISESEIIEASHDIIRRLEYLFFDSPQNLQKKVK